VIVIARYCLFRLPITVEHRVQNLLDTQPKIARCHGKRAGQLGILLHDPGKQVSQRTGNEITYHTQKEALFIDVYSCFYSYLLPFEIELTMK
jgi:hypothetical protein